MDPATGVFRITQFLEHRPKPRGFYYGSRSLNPSYAAIHKLDDVTRYNSAVHVVTRYQSSPNRCATPKKPTTQSGLVRSLKKRPLSPRSFHLSTIMKSTSLVSLEAKRELMTKARCANLRISTAGPITQAVKAHNPQDIMNDFHKRETNAGFARNQLGGIFTH